MDRWTVKDDMKKIFVLAALVTTIALSGSVYARGGSYRGHSSSYSSHSSNGGSNHAVRGYAKRNGTHVSAYHATNPDRTRNNNYSTTGNVNPYTGRAGTKSRDGQ